MYVYVLMYNRQENGTRGVFAEDYSSMIEEKQSQGKRNLGRCVDVLNYEIERFQSMPVNVTTESVDGQFSKSIDAKTCPRKVTGSYKMEDWRESKKSWKQVKECDFPEPALRLNMQIC